MKKVFSLEGERITLKRAKELLGEKRYKRFVGLSKAIFLTDPVAEYRCATNEGILTVYFRID
jgi:hypothetical protein